MPGVETGLVKTIVHKECSHCSAPHWHRLHGHGDEPQSQRAELRGFGWWSLVKPAINPLHWQMGCPKGFDSVTRTVGWSWINSGGVRTCEKTQVHPQEPEFRVLTHEAWTLPGSPEADALVQVWAQASEPAGGPADGLQRKSTQGWWCLVKGAGLPLNYSDAVTGHPVCPKQLKAAVKGV